MRFEHSLLPWPVRSVPVLDVQPYGDGWAALFADGGLLEVDAWGKTRVLAQIDFALVDPTEEVSLHLSRDGRFAAVANRRGRYGVVVDLAGHEVTLRLDRQDYQVRHCVYSLAFFEHQGRTLLVHPTDWNRLDISDPATQESLAARPPIIYSRGVSDSPHYLDYFHCGLTVSPDNRWIAEDGWIWHPLGQVRAWSLIDWMERNPYESEDGDSVQELCRRDYFWDGPLCWIGDTTLAVWGLGDWDDGEKEVDVTPGIRIFDVALGTELRSFPGSYLAPEGTSPTQPTGGWMAFDKWLFAISPEHGTGVWNVVTGEHLHHDPGIVPHRNHR